MLKKISIILIIASMQLFASENIIKYNDRHACGIDMEYLGMEKPVFFPSQSFEGKCRKYNVLFFIDDLDALQEIIMTPILYNNEKGHTVYICDQLKKQSYWIPAALAGADFNVNVKKGKVKSFDFNLPKTTISYPQREAYIERMLRDAGLPPGTHVSVSVRDSLSFEMRCKL